MRGGFGEASRRVRTRALPHPHPVTAGDWETTSTTGNNIAKPHRSLQEPLLVIGIGNTGNIGNIPTFILSPPGVSNGEAAPSPLRPWRIGGSAPSKAPFVIRISSFVIARCQLAGIAPPRLKWRGASCGRPPRRIPGAHRPGGVQAAWGSSRSGLHPRGPPGDACPPPFQTEASRVARGGVGEASSLGGSLASGPSVASATRPTPPPRRIARGLRCASPSFALHPRMGRRPAPPCLVRPSPRSPPRFVASARGDKSHNLIIS